MHTLQTIVANFEPLDDFHLNLHELNILNLLTNISMKKGNKQTKTTKLPFSVPLLSYNTDYIVVHYVIYRIAAPISVESTLN